MLRSQGMSEDQVDMILAMMERDPELFKKIEAETKEKVKGGMSQQMASMAVMMKYKHELQKLMQQ